MRSLNRSTASGSPAASPTASDSSVSAPMGVLSSWLTLATKSRRISSTRRDPGPDVGGRDPRADDQVALADLAVAAHLVDQLEQLLDHQPVAAHQPQRERRRAGLEHVVLRVDHDGRRAQHRQHRVHARGHHRLRLLGHRLLYALADPERQDRHGTEHDADGADHGEREGVAHRSPCYAA
jgi:hypothetical protein